MQIMVLIHFPFRRQWIFGAWCLRVNCSVCIVPLSVVARKKGGSSSLAVTVRYSEDNVEKTLVA